ncbi:MAG: hypothetical protein IH934_05950 [Nanoarchaeota archaeon]|nr:hypothetical protein [Nanoarchaeota archaeon]
MAKKRKKTPKNSRKNEKKENAIILGIFLIFIAVVAYLFYFLNIKTSDEDIIASVNGNEITRDELDWWYKVSILPEYRDIITKQDFLMLSLLPQEVLVQQAKKQNIKVKGDDVEKLLGLFIIENGLTLDEFEKHLSSRSLTIEDIKKSFETRAFINKLLEKENIFIGDETVPDDGTSMQEYVDNLIDSSDIKIFPENIEKLVLRSFEATGDEICDEDKPIIRLYTTRSCSICEESDQVFEALVNGLVKDGKIGAMHWSLDTGDDLLTLEKEKGIPKEEVEIFKKYSPNKLVPAVVLGCKYKKIGKFGLEERDEFKAILKVLTGG